MANDDLIGSAEACDILAIDRATLSRWVAAHKLALVVQLPGSNGAMVFRRSDVEALAVDAKASS